MSSSSGNHFPSYLLPPIAGCSMIPFYYAFAIKSAQQIEAPIPKLTLYQALHGGVRIAPTVGVIVGAQLLLQEKVDQKCKALFSSEIASMVASSAIIGAFSSPFLAVFNGKTMGYTTLQTLQKLSFQQITVIASREIAFLGSLAITTPLSSAMKKRFGDRSIVLAGSSFVAGAIGGIFGHGFDTTLTRWQKGLKVENLSQLRNGAMARSFGLGGFNIIFQLAKEKLKEIYVDIKHIG